MALATNAAHDPKWYFVKQGIEEHSRPLSAENSDNNYNIPCNSMILDTKN